MPRQRVSFNLLFLSIMTLELLKSVLQTFAQAHSEMHDSAQPFETFYSYDTSTWLLTANTARHDWVNRQPSTTKKNYPLMDFHLFKFYIFYVIMQLLLAVVSPSPLSLGRRSSTNPTSAYFRNGATSYSPTRRLIKHAAKSHISHHNFLKSEPAAVYTYSHCNSERHHAVPWDLRSTPIIQHSTSVE